jgi:glutamate/tyrosine decarboxylase-like PLP-dependent enzyme
MGTPDLDATLDPKNWDDFRALGHRMIDDATSMLSSVRERPVWTSVPAHVRRSLDEPVPFAPTAMEDVYEQARRDVMPYPLGNIHPRFWGWVIGSGAPAGVLADWIAAAMNSNCGGYDQTALFVEQQVLKWLATLFGLPPSSTGILVSSGSQANFVALAVARTAKAGFPIRELGVAGGPPLAFYASVETHACVQKAIETLGHGRQALRRLPVDADFRLDLRALEQAIAADRANGVRPACVVGNAGTVNTGSLDDLTAIAAIARREDLWFHVDGAIGAVTALSPTLKRDIAGVERADSVAFDLHKWLYLPYDIGGVLVRDAAAHRATFELTPSYLAPLGRGIAPEPFPFPALGLDLSRGFRALKAWMAIKTYGIDGYARMIEQNVAQASYLASLVDAHAELERLAPAPLNIVCFRYMPAGGESAVDAGAVDKVNEAILIALQERGIAVPSGTRIGGRFAIRVAITNHRSRREDFDLLADSVVAIGREVSRRT